MCNRLPIIALITMLIVLTGGLGGLGWVVHQQREALDEQMAENRQFRRDLAATQETVNELEQSVETLLLAGDWSLADRVNNLEEAVGDKPLGYRSRATVVFNAGLWDELQGIGRELDDLQQCVDSVVNVIRFNYSFVSC